MAWFEAPSRCVIAKTTVTATAIAARAPKPRVRPLLIGICAQRLDKSSATTAITPPRKCNCRCMPDCMLAPKSTQASAWGHYPIHFTRRQVRVANLCWSMSGRNAILVAEDDLNDAFFLEHALAKLGVSVRARFVKTGQEAIDYLQGNPPFNQRGENPLPGLLVLDLKMPF